MVNNSVYLCILVLISVFGIGHSNSPCPNIFEFYSDEKDVFGLITLRPVETQAQLNISITFTVQGVLGAYNGKIESDKNILARYNRGETVTCRVYFPVLNPRPKVTEITLNGQILCTGPGDKPTTGPVSRSTLSVKHYYGGGGGPPPYKSFSQQESTTASPHTDKRFGTSDSDNSPFHPSLLESQTHPVRQPAWKSTELEYSRPTTNRPWLRPDDHYTNECGVVTGGNQVQQLAYNGLSYERGQIPWLVAIFMIDHVFGSLKFICGGTLVSDRHVVTAAHCKEVQGVTTPTSDIVVRLGVHNLADWGDDISITTMIMHANIHESYNGSDSLENDIMVLTLKKRIKFNRYIRPVCLWSADTELERVVGATGIVAGWGDRNDGSSRWVEPQMVRIPIVSNKDCKASHYAFHQITYDTTFCGGDKRGAGPCKGDSGGGLYLLNDSKWRLRGVVSVILRENLIHYCNLNKYVVFTDTAQYLPWIRNILSQRYYD